MDKQKLGDIATVEISGVDKKTKDGEQEIRLCNFVDVYYNWAITTAQHDSFMLATARPNEISKFQLKNGQVALTKDSETRYDIGVPTYIADDFDDVILGYHCALITPNKDILDGRYLNALLHTDYAKKYFACNASGSGQRYALSVEALNSFPVPVIPLQEQKRIGEIFSALDKKIELNRAINQNLEAMAKQLFDYWFVQFDFPNEDGKPYKSSGGKMVWNDKLKREIPERWNVVDVSEVADVQRGQIITSKNTTAGNIKVVAAGVTYSYFNGESNRPKNTITVSGSGANAGFINFWREPIFASDCTTVNCKTETDTLLCLYGLLLFQDRLFNLAIGAAQPHVYPTHVGSIPILDIPQKIKERVSDFFCETNSVIGTNLAEIDSLTKQRDDLLPLLMNGQVSVNSDLSHD